jgi:hypothetical protein
MRVALKCAIFLWPQKQKNTRQGVYCIGCGGRI